MSRRTRIKICGVSRTEDVDAAVDAGADAVGFVFHAASPRAVTVAQAAALARALPPFVTPVGLFVNAEASLLTAACEAIPALLLQFHGDETPACCLAARRPFLRAARIDTGFDLLDFASRFSGALGLVLDANVEGWGGGGKVFDWSLVPQLVPHRLVLSGGLRPANVAAGIQALRPWAVDVSSGVESSRGVKDAAAIQAFCDAVREADFRIAAAVS
ncbi:MAG: phosphoribosylanthranilate isomerase [Pseudomonadota bacterium]|nr:phosphoribosylanthranilate isomerase [Pseudomonadota bacterium]